MRISSVMAVICSATVVGSAANLGAQAGPPLAKAPRDSAPALIKPRAPSLPPSSVAPRGAVAQRTAIVAPVDSGPRLMKRIGLPVDSVRPAPTPEPEVTALKKQPPPPAPSRTNPAVQQVTQRAAALTSDEPSAAASARCKDGTYITAVVDDNTCSDRGGVAVKFPPPRQAPKRPNP